MRKLRQIKNYCIVVTPSIEYYKEVGRKFYQNITWKPEGKLGTIAMDIYTEVLISTDSLLRINCYLKNEKTQSYEFASEEKVNYQSTVSYFLLQIKFIIIIIFFERSLKDGNRVVIYRRKNNEDNR